MVLPMRSASIRQQVKSAKASAEKTSVYWCSNYLTVTGSHISNRLKFKEAKASGVRFWGKQ